MLSGGQLPHDAPVHIHVDGPCLFGLPYHKLLRDRGRVHQAAAWTALNGVGLALVMPCVQAILAEVYYARQRGRAFGLLFTISAFGGMLFNFVAVTFGDRTVGGLPVCCCYTLCSAQVNPQEA